MPKMLFKQDRVSKAASQGNGLRHAEGVKAAERHWVEPQWSTETQTRLVDNERIGKYRIHAMMGTTIGPKIANKRFVCPIAGNVFSFDS